MEIDKLALIAGADIPIPILRTSIRQPRLKEIAVLGEKKFYSCISLFNINRETTIKQILSAIDEDIDEKEKENLAKSVLGDANDFDIFMQVVGSDTQHQIDVISILSLLMPDYQFDFEERFIVGTSTNPNKDMIIINDEGFLQLKDIINIIFCLGETKKDEFNPVNDQAKIIAEKLERARETVRNSKGESREENYIIANYLSFLGVGLNALNLLQAIDLTVFQLFNQVERFNLKIQHEYGIQAMMAGASDVEMVDWMKNL